MNYKFLILRNHIEIGELYVSDAKIIYDSSKKIKRSATLTISANNFKMAKIVKQNGTPIYFDGSRFFDGTWCFSSSLYEEETFEFDMLKDRVQIYIDGVSVGVFIVVSSPLNITTTENTYELEAFDESFIVQQSATSSRLFFSKGTKYIAAISAMLVKLGFSDIVIDDSTLIFNIDREFEIGKSYIDLINQLLEEINYMEFHLNESGHPMIIKNKNRVIPEHIYIIDDNSKIKNDINKEIDLYNVPNVFIGYCSNPDSEPLIYKKINDEIGSKVSTISRGFEIVAKYQLNNVPNYQELVSFVDNKYIESKQIAEIVKLDTSIESGHGHLDMVQIDVRNDFDIHLNSLNDGLFVQKGWEIDLKGNSMSHSLERKVFV